MGRVNARWLPPTISWSCPTGGRSASTAAPIGALQVKRASGGGLVVCLGPGVERNQALWLAAATSADDLEAARQGPVEAEGFRVQPVQVDPDDYRAYYDVVANQTLWFACTGCGTCPAARDWTATGGRRGRRSRPSTNARGRRGGHSREGRDRAGPGLPPGPRPGPARRPPPRRTGRSFVHTRGARPRECWVRPTRSRRRSSGLSNGGPCGFHSRRWAAAFEACCETHLAGRPGTSCPPRVPNVEDLRSVASSPACDEELRRLDALIGDRQLIVRVDRMELSKNVLRGFWAFDELLEHPTRPPRPGRFHGKGLPVSPGSRRVPGVHAGGPVSRRPAQLQVGRPGLDPDPARHGRLLPELRGGAAAGRRPARQPGTRRAQPGREGRPAGQRARGASSSSASRPEQRGTRWAGAPSGSMTST